MVRRALALLVLMLSTLSAMGAPEERWYVVMMQDQRAGWMVERVETLDDRIETSMQMVFSIGRGGVDIDLHLESGFVETLDHEPISMRSLQRLGALPMETRYEFEGDEVAVTSVQGARESTRRVASPDGEWMTPTQASEHLQARLEAGESIITMRTLDALSGLDPVSSTLRVGERTTVEVMGKTVSAIECQIEQSILPGIQASQFMSDDGRIVRSTVNLGQIEMVVLLSEREIALAPLEGVEVMASTFIRPSERIDNPRAVREGHYDLILESGDLPRIPDTGAQVVMKQEGGRARLVVNADAHHMAQQDDHRDARYMSPSPMIDSEDERITALSRRALRSSARDDMSRLETLRRFVHEYIDEKSLDVGFASASEVAQVREGDCTEHAVLLAAMARAEGYPSRVASGLLYADEFVGHRGIFAYHAWTQVLVQHKGVWTWVDLDATLDETRFDATHICLTTSAFSEGDSINSMGSIAMLMGQLSIETLSVR
ncbi:MAG: transglutaminase family protein [Phycisphaerales bacterium JB043]